MRNDPSAQRGGHEDKVSKSPSPTATSAVKWNGLALIGKQGATILATILLARILGPSAYGVIAQATLYITLTTLLLDQGLSSALIASEKVSRRQLGAAASVNLVLCTVLFGLTFLTARPVGLFFNSTSLSAVLIVLGAGLYLKAAAIVPRVIISRTLNFRALALIEPLSAVVGAIAAILAALAGFTYWSLVIQIVIGDLVLLAGLFIAARPPWPNAEFRTLRHTIGFGVRAFGDQLISYFARNLDNILVGRYFGATQLSYYALSYRVLLTPIALVGQVVTRVLFPALARVRGDPARVSSLITRSIRAIAVISFPSMLILSVGSWDLIYVALGSAWLPAAPVLCILAVTGARQAVTSVNSPILLAMNRPDVQIRFSLTAAVVQVGGMLCGLPWGIVGVATGYTVAGIALTPLIGMVQSRVTSMAIRSQLAPLLPSLHGSFWAVLAYASLGLLPISREAHLLMGALLGLAVYVLILRFVHKATWNAVFADGRAILGIRTSTPVPTQQ